MKIVSIFRKDTTNIGDRFSNPALYFDFIKSDLNYDIWRDNLSQADLDENIIILGGGGLIANVDFERNINKIFESKKAKLIGWGVGHNKHDETKVDYSYFHDKFDLLGSRDHLDGLHWVPCASCMHSAFDSKYEIKHKVIVYEHEGMSLNINEYPKQSNESQDMNDTISFLASGETIITNTYHGAYWGLLLGRKVLLINTFSSKFHAMKYPLFTTSMNNYKEDLSKAMSYNSALLECRKANSDFARIVKEEICLGG